MEGRDDGLDVDGAGQAPAGVLSAAGLAGEWSDLIGRSEPSSETSSETSSGAGHPQRGSLRQPWQAEAAVSAARDEALDPDAPDFGIRFARCFVAACRRGVIPRRRKRGLLRQHREGLKWIRHAIRHLERQGEGLADGGGALSPPQRAVRDAIGIDRDPQQRGLVRRLLIAYGAEVAKVARALRLDAAAVEAYQALFFDVRDRHQHPFRFVAALGDAPLVSGREAVARDLPPLWEFASMSLPEALQRCGLAGREGAAAILNEAADSGEAQSFESAARRVLMTPDRIDPESREVAKALLKYEAMQAELRKEKPVPVMTESFIKAIKSMRDLQTPEPLSGQNDDVSGAADGAMAEPLHPAGGELPDGDAVSAGRDLADTSREFKGAYDIIAELEAAEQADLAATPEFAPLTVADLGRVRELWRECRRIQTEREGPVSRGKLPILEPLWKKSLRPGLPADAWERAGAGELPAEMEAPDFGWQLARTAAACGLQAQLPAGDAFHWIRLAAEALVPSDKACAGGSSRRMLRMAMDLHRRPAARHLLQAALLTRDAGIGEVAAFLALDPRVVAAYATLFFNVPGRAGGDLPRPRPGQGSAAPLGKAPELTLEQLQWLLGFKSPGKDPADAARMLMGYVSELAAGQGMHESWNDEEPRKPRRPAGRGSKAFESVVATAGKMMDASVFSADAALSGIGPLLEKQMRRPRNASHYRMRLQMFIDSGLTKAEAERQLHAAKEERRAGERRKMERQTPANHG